MVLFTLINLLLIKLSLSNGLSCVGPKRRFQVYHRIKKYCSGTIQSNQNRQIKKKNRQNVIAEMKKLTLICLSLALDFLAKGT